ncbi:hypothetical protein CAEBREN_26074 [Caenorhabditis brenneri]|uniref:Serpentine Receptor, class H n=1 Tax=Caenorhabditis brenneri TaxID=135651 RepID=G0NHU0_CAEBE|nr:hypothetical protein CAEBREN_26074 [Caenorhabditis brenneri]
MHYLHLITTPVYVITLVALFKETSQLFQKYKYYLIVHIITNFLSEGYVSFMWLPRTHLPYDVYKSTGILAHLNLSGVFQFLLLAQFLAFTGVSILEMFHYRFKSVVLHQSGKFYTKLPTFGIYLFRFLIVMHLLVFIWSMADGQTIVYQKNKMDELFQKFPGLPAEIRCYTVFILAPEDPILIMSVILWGVLCTIGTVVVLTSVMLINHFLNKTKNLSKETKKLQKMLVFSLLAQATIHVVMILFPVLVQIYQMIFILYNNDFVTVLLFCVAYHGFLSTCAMIVFTKQIRLKVLLMFRKCMKPKAVLIGPHQFGGQFAYVESFHG